MLYPAELRGPGAKLRDLLSQTGTLCSLWLAAGALVVVVPAGAAALEAPCDLVRSESGVVSEVIDGETLRLSDGVEVRLVGALGVGDGTPESEAARAWLETEVAGRAVVMGYGGRREDRRGRRLAQVFAGEGGLWVQGALVDMGLARAYSFADNRACARDLLAREAAARGARLGLWRDGGSRIHRADRPAEILPSAGTYAIVQGTVLSVGERRARTYLNFGTYWNEDFTVVVSGRDRDRFADTGLDLSGLSGSVVRVRGWILDERGPAIEATHPEQIELVDDR